MSAVRTPYGPALPELLGPRLWRVVRPIAIALALAAIAIAWRPRDSESVVVSRGAPAFNFIYQAPLRRFGAAGVEELRGDVFVQSMDVHRFALGPYRGDPSAVLPLIADRLARTLARDHPGFEPSDEGRTRINESVGYYFAWEGRIGKRKLFARDYLLVPDGEDAPRVGAHLELRSTYAGGVSSSDDVGRIGKLKRSLRSFRFGTERP